MSQSSSPPTPPVTTGATERIISLDVLKGVAIILVILAHVAMYSFIPEEKWIYFVVYTFLDVFGPSMFVFLSCLGVVFSIKKKRGGTADKKSRNAVFQRAAIMFVIGCVPNIVSNFKFGWLSFWFWFILQFLAFSQIITFYALKLPKITRMIIAFLLIFIITPGLFENITTSMAAAGIDYRALRPEDLSNPYALGFWFLFYPAYMTPPLPWIAVPLIASIVGDSLVDAVSQGTREAKMSFLKSTIVDGIIFVMFSIGFGATVVNTDYGLNIIFGINYMNPYFQITGLPEFLIMHTNFNLLYNMGMSMILFSIVFYFTEVRGMRGRKLNFLNFYGRFSLSLFVYHALLGIFFPNMLTIPWLVVYIIFVYAALYYLLKMLVVKFEGIGTLEWVASKMGRAKASSKSFFETNIRAFKEGFQKLGRKVKGLFVPEYPVENPLEAFIYDALSEYDHIERPREEGKQEKEKEPKKKGKNK